MGTNNSDLIQILEDNKGILYKITNAYAANA